MSNQTAVKGTVRHQSDTAKQLTLNQSAAKQFTVEEINLICIYNTKSRDALLTDLIEAVNGFGTENTLSDAGIFEIAVSALDKVSKMSDKEFSALELCPIFDGGETDGIYPIIDSIIYETEANG